MCRFNPLSIVGCDGKETAQPGGQNPSPPTPGIAPLNPPPPSSSNGYCPITTFPSICSVYIPTGATIAVGTCIVPGSACTGDTTVSIITGANVLAYNDDGYNNAACNSCSYIEYTNNGPGQYISIQTTCYANNACGGTTAWSITPTNRPPPPPSASPPPSTNLGPVVACSYVSHHFFGTNFADATLSPAVSTNATLNGQTGLQTDGTGGLSLVAPLGNIGWSLTLSVGSTTSTQVRSLVDLQGLSLYVQNGQFFLA